MEIEVGIMKNIENETIWRMHFRVAPFRYLFKEVRGVLETRNLC